MTAPLTRDDLAAMPDAVFLRTWRKMNRDDIDALDDGAINFATNRFASLSPELTAAIDRLRRAQENERRTRPETVTDDEANARFAGRKNPDTKKQENGARPVSAVKIDGAALLNSVRAFFARFVAFPSPYYLDTATLWAAHAHMVKHFHTSPRLALLSPEPESGKTRGLEILELLTPDSMLIVSPSVAAIFRKLAQEQVTLLFDEVDTIFTKRGKDDQNEDLRALINAGYRRGASIPRCVGPKHEVQDFRVFAAVALAGIGDLPGTIMTRSIVLNMQRRSATEQIEQFRLRVHEPEGHKLRDQLGMWACVVGPAAGASWPELPDEVVDRRAEAWEPLLAVADAAGGDWPDRSRRAAVSNVSHVSLYMGVSASLGIRLLSDLRGVFGNTPALFTDDALAGLKDLDESPWGDLHGHGLNSRGLAMRLKQYGVTSKQVRVGEKTAKGYRRDDLHDVWSRYLPVSHPIQKETRETNETNGDCPRCAGEGCKWCAA